MDRAGLPAEWDAAADTFDVEPDHGLQNPAVRQAWMHLLGSLLPEPPARVADLGCGTGSIALLLAARGFEVVGMDFSSRMIERARSKADAAGSRATFRMGDVTAPELDDSGFDVVFARHVVWALPDPLDALRRWVRLLTPGGRLVLVEGRWREGTGLDADRLVALLEPFSLKISVHPLSDAMLWGKEITDERYALVAIHDTGSSDVS